MVAQPSPDQTMKLKLNN
uniref:Uncharacterized protein n=1 Tax=Rhizophora mucronata TaxID=61149 RepID=A0A2P2QLX4_RHIMU